MGCLRFALAFAVFNAHAGLPIGFSVLAGYTAVHCFFVISGFYMAMVLSEKYGAGVTGYVDFMTSRLLRLMPSYWVVLVLTLLLAGLSRTDGAGMLTPLAAAGDLAAQGASAGGLLAHAGAQLSLIGQDLYAFLGWTSADGLYLASTHRSGPATLSNLLLVPPAWSLSLELYFYLLAPWFVRRRTGVLLAIMAASLGCRLALAGWLDWRQDPWSYRFFPSELLYFLSGVLIYRLSPRLRALHPFTLAGACALGALLGAVEVFSIWQPDMPMHKWARVPLFAALCAGVPLLFHWTRHSARDRYVGELSYPLYLSHCLALWAAAPLLGDALDLGGRVLLIALALGLTVALHRLVDAPVDRWRQMRLARVKRAHALPA